MRSPPKHASSSARRRAGGVASLLVSVTIGCQEEPALELDVGPVEHAGGIRDDELTPEPVSETHTNEGCGLSVAGPYWMTEGETLALPIRCQSAALRGEDLRFEGLPEGARFDTRRSTLYWVPTFAQAGVYDFTIHVLEPTDTANVRVGVADAFDDPRNVPIRDPSRYPLEYGLPVFFLTSPENEKYAPSTLVYRGETYEIEIKTRGQTSLAFDKHSYTLKFDDDHRFRESDEDTGLVDRKKITLTTTFDDNSYLRQRLAHEVWARMSPTHLGVKSFSAVVYIDGEFHGIYAATDHVDRHLMKQLGLSSSGELFKARSHQGSFATRSHGMTKKEGVPEEGEPGWDASLTRVIDFVMGSSDAEFEAELENYVDVAEYQDWYAFVLLTRATDTTGKNAYHYLERPDAAFRFVPWDFNASFGQSYRTLRTGAVNGKMLLERNLLWRRMVENPRMRREIAARVHSAVNGPLREQTMLALVNRYAEEVLPAVQRDWRRWGYAYLNERTWRDRDDFTTFEEEVQYLREWIGVRWQFLDAEIEQLLTAAAAGVVDAPEDGSPDDGSPDDSSPDEMDESVEDD